MANHELFDVTIIGGGPAGLYSAFYSGLREMKTKIVEYQPELGGKVQIYPEKMVWDVGGLLPTPGAQLREQLVQQGLTFNPDVVVNEKITSIDKDEVGNFVLHSASGRKHYSKTVIVATGSGILKPQKLNIEGAERFEVSNLHYTIKSLARFKDKTVVISGGGNSAIDWANELEGIAKQVYLTYRKGDLKGHEAQISQLHESSVTCLPYTQVTKLLAKKDASCIEYVELNHSETGESQTVAIDEMVINHGFDRDASLLENSLLDLQLIQDTFIEGTALSESSVDGIYAAGDILMHEGKLNLIAGAFQDAANAVNRAKTYIDPTAQKAGLVSSHNDVFKERNKKLVQEMIR
ncbi:ferredoxin--NADP reductase [Pontibacillus halophilus JSM 076056 = DSM 19796]|uniref:Ferredoxin--NADP reductase n=1 Tax=Pontibacillus halophilus JSM 076056 = DSM 19796 TaxID=1385510 RepID=A0A0A5GMA9_9BACI|nr:NAD(P)/FAD-dependent oxidoreductase [Pontibacillus halophilus]KGX92363.1 ferredoxin--NADP reductase [Pontibacillus halophilus JSM 076056 = DSM 19796]